MAPQTHFESFVDNVSRKLAGLLSIIISFGHTGYPETTNAADNNKRSWNQ